MLVLAKNPQTCGLTEDRGGKVVGLNPSIRIYRYSKGQFFDCHCESSSGHVISNSHPLQTMNPIISLFRKSQ